MPRRPTIIKAGAALAVAEAAPRRFELDDILAQAEATARNTRVEADRIVAAARSRAEVIRRQAQEEGYEAGREAGLIKGQEAGQAEALESASRLFAEQQRSLIASCQRIIAEIDAGRAAWEASARRDLIDLAMAIARRVVRRVSQRDREVVLANIDEAIELAGTRSDVTIMVNPDDAEAARQFARSLADVQEQCQHVHVTQDAEVSPGGCRIQWGSGQVDARLETQLDRIETELNGGPTPEGEPSGDVTEI